MSAHEKELTVERGTPALSIKGLKVLHHPDKKHSLEIVKGIDLTLRRGTIHGLAGESGSGKTMTALATLGLLPVRTAATGSIRLESQDVNLLQLSQKQLQTVRGARVAMVFQDPSTSLHPQLTVLRQLTDHLRTHRKDLSKAQAKDHALGLLQRVAVPEPEEALKKYPHQFSGGQRQRIAIAVALACEPEVLLADEPTTALDVTVQAGILHLLRELVDGSDLAVLLVTHDLGVMSSVADEVSVMRYGRIVETGTRRQIFTDPQDDYTKSLLAAMPGADLEGTDQA